MNTPRTAAHIATNESKGPAQFQSLESCTSVDPKDYVWGTVTPGTQSQLFGQFMQMAFMCSPFLPGPMQFPGPAPFPSCPPWMMPFHGGLPIAPHPPAATTTVEALHIKEGPISQPKPSSGDSNASDSSQYLQGKGKETGTVSKANKSKKTAAKTDYSRSRSSKLNDGAVKGKSIDDETVPPAMEVLEPLDVDDIRKLFQDDLLQGIQGDCFSGASSGSNDTRFHSPSQLKQQPSASPDSSQLFGDSPVEDDGSLSLAAFDHGFDHLDRGFKGVCSSFDALVDLDALMDMHADDNAVMNTAIVAEPCKKSTKSKQTLKVNKSKGGVVCKRSASAPVAANSPLVEEDDLRDLLGCGPDNSINWDAKISFEDMSCFGL